jgi:hypothetical protein
MAVQLIPLALRALLAAARSRPNMALPIKNIPKAFQPRVALNPLTGKPIPSTRAASGRMNPPPREFTADQVRNARLIGAAVPAGVGAAGAGAANIISSGTDAPPSARPPVDTTGMSPEEAALAQQQAESAIDWGQIFSRTPPVVKERARSLQLQAQAGALLNNPNPSLAAIGKDVLTPPSSEELLQRKMEAASRAAQPSEDLNPSENDIEAALRIARQRALESAYSREDQNRMLSDQNAFRSMEGEPGYTGPGAAGMWSGIDMRAQPVVKPLDREESIRFSDIPGGPARLPTAAGSSTAPARPTGAASTAVRREPIDFTSGARSAPAQGASPSFSLSRLFSGPEYQSTGDLVVKQGGQGVNFGSGESAADFFRADRELRKQRPEMFERQAEARGGAPKSSGGGGKDAALHKALEIIHHMLVRGR